MPKVIFTYSSIYDDMFRRNWDAAIPKKKTAYPSEREVRAALRRIERGWRPHEKRIFRELERVTGLTWDKKDIACYVVGRSFPFSDPLTLPSYVNRDMPVSRAVDVLTHELIHQLISQPSATKFVTPRFKKFTKSYAHENRNTRLHILIHAIHKPVLIKLFGQKRFEIEIKETQAYEDYRRAWEIVETDGSGQILSSFFGARFHPQA